MARKAKKKVHQMPPLSLVDKLVYWAAFLLLCAAYVALLFCPLYLRYTIAFSDETVIAAKEHASVLWLIVPWMTFFLMSLILWLLPYQKRIPIFGRKDFKYGPPAWPKIYPLLMKNKPYVWVSERKKNERKQIAIILLMVLLVGFIPFPWSLYGRDCLRSDGSIVQYNMFDSQTNEFTSGDITDIKIETYRYSTGKYLKKRHWGVRMVFKTDGGREIAFDHSDFRNDEDSEIVYWLAWMVKVKNRFDPSMIHYHGIEALDDVLADRRLDLNEEALLYQLFGQ